MVVPNSGFVVLPDDLDTRIVVRDGLLIKRPIEVKIVVIRKWMLDRVRCDMEPAGQRHVVFTFELQWRRKCFKSINFKCYKSNCQNYIYVRFRRERNAHTVKKMQIHSEQYTNFRSQFLVWFNIPRKAFGLPCKLHYLVSGRTPRESVVLVGSELSSGSLNQLF